MKFEESLAKMEELAEKHFSTYTIQIEKYCNGDWKIEVCHVPENGFLHKFVFSSMESKTMYHRKLELSQEWVIEVMEHPPPTGGLGVKGEEGESSFANTIKLHNL